MPLYEYKCGACGHRFERIVKFSDAPLKTCPQCGKDAVEQMIHAPAVQFKGSGWYVSDYARKSPPSGAKTSAGSEGAETVSGSKDDGASQESSGKPASGSAEKTAGSGSGKAAGESAKPSGHKSGDKK